MNHIIFQATHAQMRNLRTGYELLGEFIFRLSILHFYMSEGIITFMREIIVRNQVS